MKNPFMRIGDHYRISIVILAIGLFVTGDILNNTGAALKRRMTATSKHYTAESEWGDDFTVIAINEKLESNLYHLLVHSSKGGNLSCFSDRDYIGEKVTLTKTEYLYEGIVYRWAVPLPSSPSFSAK